MNSKMPYLLAVLLLLGLGIAATFISHNSAPAVVFNIIDGQRINMESLRGKPVLINFWSVSCPPCIEEMPALEKLYQSTKGTLTMIGVAMPQDRPDLVIDFSNRLGISYPVALDLDAALVGAFAIQAVPTTLLYDASGQLISRTLGIVDTDALEKTLHQLTGD